MSEKQMKPEMHLPPKHRLYKRLVAALIIVVALALLMVAGLKLVADKAASDYGQNVRKQKTEIAADLKKLAELSKQQQGEAADTAKLKEAVRELNESISAYEPPKPDDVPLGLLLSQAYQQARRDANDFQNDTGRLEEMCAKLVGFAEFHTSLQKILSNSSLFTTVGDQKAALAREKSWRAASTQLAALMPSETALKAAAALFSDDAKSIADLLKAAAAHFKTQDTSKIEQDQDKIEKKIAEMRKSVGVLAEFRHDLGHDLTDAVAKLD